MTIIHLSGGIHHQHTKLNKETFLKINTAEGGKKRKKSPGYLIST
jgi:hypothetical protein